MAFIAFNGVQQANCMLSDVTEDVGLERRKVQTKIEQEPGIYSRFFRKSGVAVR